MITIETKIIGESIQLLSSPVVASKSVKSVQILFDFDDAWNGFGRIALFWGVDDEVYTSQIINGVTIVPHEALDETGKIKFGVYGTNGNKRIVTVKMTYKIVEGAYTSVATESVEPSASLLDQIEAGIGVMEDYAQEMRDLAAVGTVRCDMIQTLTDAQKATGRGNIDAADAAAVAALDEAIAGKVAINQGSMNAGKALIVGADGIVTTGDTGISEAIKKALLQIALHAAYADANGQSYYNALVNAFSGDVPITGRRIEAVFEPGVRTIYTDDPLNTLKPLTTVIYYSDDDSDGEIISEYTINGSLESGNNNVDISYDGLHTAISVVASVPKYVWKLSDGDIALWNYGYDTEHSPSPGRSRATMTTRRLGYCNTGRRPYVDRGNGDQLIQGAYLIPIPADARTATLTVTPSTMYPSISEWRLNSSQTDHWYVLETGWQQGTATLSLSNNDLRALSFTLKYNSSGSTFASEPSEIVITFTT